VSCAAWLPDSKHFVTGSIDKNIYMWNTSGEQLRQWNLGRIQDMAVTSDGSTLICVTNSRYVHFLNLIDDSSSKYVVALLLTDND